MKTAACIILLTLAASTAEALEFCRSDETIDACYERFFSQETEGKKEKARTETSDEQWKRLTSKATGPDIPDLDLESATEDFLPTLRFALALAGLQGGLDRSALNFEQKIGSFGLDRTWELKIQGAVNETDVFGPLKMAFTDEVRDQRVAALKEDLDQFDDYSVTLSANRGSERFGRSPNAYSQKVFQTLFEQVVEASESAFDDAADFALLDALENRATPDQRFDQLAPEVAEDIEQKVLASARGTIQVTETLKKNADSFEIFRVADLLNNQPQINFSGSYRLREGAAGPDELTIKASYEHGFANLNALRGRCGDPDANRAAFTTCYRNFMKDTEVKAELEKGDRFSISAEYSQVDSYLFSLPTDNVDLDLDSQSGLVITAAYARYIPLLGDSSSRIDLTGKYESENDRGVITATYTNRALQALGGSIGISYANHERFLPESDHVISAHIGLSFQAFSREAPSNPETP